MRNWKWLPLPLRSLEPYDRALMKVTGNCFCCRKVGCLSAITEESDKRKQNEQNIAFNNGLNGVKKSDMGNEPTVEPYVNDAYDTTGEAKVSFSTKL